MAKNLYRGEEVKISKEKVHLAPPEIQVRQQQNLQREAMQRQLSEYDGPTVEQLRREAEEFRAGWEEEKARMIESAKRDAERIIQEAEDHAFEEVKKKNDQALKIKQEADAEAEKLLEKSRTEAELLRQQVQKEVEDLRESVRKEAWQTGFEKGFAEGEAESSRLVERVHVVLTKAVERRNEIIEESESQIVQLVLQIVKKVVKVLSENQKNIVINNVVQALRKLKSKSDIVIRVNLSDLRTTSEHTKELISKFEKVNSITVMEDATVDPGGCIIETDFGQIDARISSQLREIEERILELTPIASRPNPVTGS